MATMTLFAIRRTDRFLRTAMNGKPDAAVLEKLVQQTARYFREREDAVRAL